MRAQTALLLVAIPLVVGGGILVEAGYRPAVIAAMLLVPNGGLLVLMWALRRALKTGQLPTRGGAGYERSTEPFYFWMTFGLYVLVGTAMTVFALVTDWLLWSEWNGN